MKVRKSRLFIAGGVLLSCFFLGATAAALWDRPPGWLLAPVGGGTVAVMSGLTSDGRSIEVRVECGRLGFFRRGYRRVMTEMLWGYEPPPSLLDPYLHQYDFLWRMTATVDDATIAVPPEAFMDLVQIRPARIESAAGRFFIHFDGSDAGESYHGFIEVEGSAVVRREVWYGEFPEYRESKTFRAGRVVMIASTLPTSD